MATKIERHHDQQIEFQNPSDHRRYLRITREDGLLRVEGYGRIHLTAKNTADLVAWLTSQDKPDPDDP